MTPYLGPGHVGGDGPDLTLGLTLPLTLTLALTLTEGPAGKGEEVQQQPRTVVSPVLKWTTSPKQKAAVPTICLHVHSLSSQAWMPHRHLPYIHACIAHVVRYASLVNAHNEYLAHAQHEHDESPHGTLTLPLITGLLVSASGTAPHPCSASGTS